MTNENFRMNRRDVKTAIPVDTIEIPIRQIDWRRIYRKVKSIPKQDSFYLTITGISFGVGGSALLSLLPMYQAAQNVAPWVKPTYWIVGVCAIIIGLITAYFHNENDEVIKSSCLEVQKDMKEVHSVFFPNDDLDKD
jgi:hypothetical protein